MCSRRTADAMCFSRTRQVTVDVSDIDLKQKIIAILRFPFIPFSGPIYTMSFNL